MFRIEEASWSRAAFFLKDEGRCRCYVTWMTENLHGHNICIFLHLQDFPTLPVGNTVTQDTVFNLPSLSTTIRVIFQLIVSQCIYQYQVGIVGFHGGSLNQLQ